MLASRTREALDRIYTIDGYFRVVAGSIDSDQARAFLLAREPEQREVVETILDGAVEEARAAVLLAASPKVGPDLLNRLVLKHAQSAFGLEKRDDS